MVTSVVVGKFIAALIRYLSLANVFASVFILLHVFVVATDDVIVPVIATMSKRGGYIVNYYPIGILTVLERNVLRPQDVWSWLQDTWLLKKENSMTELSSSYYCS